MLKPSRSTESTTRPGNGGIGVGGDGSGNGGDEGGHDDEHLSWGLGQLHQQTNQLIRPSLRSNIMGLMVVMASGSKSRQKMKNLKGIKNCKGHRFRQTFIKKLILRRLNTLPLELWKFFKLFMLGLGALLIPFLNRLPIKQSKWSC